MEAPTARTALQIATNFRTYVSPSAEESEKLEIVRAACRQCATTIAEQTPEGRELALALTKLEEAMLHANAGIARAWGNRPTP